MADDNTTTDTTDTTDTAPEAPEAPKPADKPKVIPYDRFAEVYEEMITLRSQVKEMGGVAEAKTALEAELSTFKKQYETDKSLWASGLTDPEGQEVAKFLWRQTPEDSRPEGGIGAWLQGFQGEDATDPPKALAPYLTAPATPRPDPDAGTTPTQPSADAPVSAESLRAARDKALRTGNQDEYRRLAKALHTELGWA